MYLMSNFRLSNEKKSTIIGPTASGKTFLSVVLAKKLEGEIIGLDSRQVYDGISIGTAQPTKEDMDGIPHHLFGSVSYTHLTLPTNREV